MKYPSKEWSGILFYTTESTLNSLDDVQLVGQYLYLLDIGSGAWTEYEPSTQLMDVYDKFPEAIEWLEGHIHSHHNMKAFFSGTDNATVIEHGSQVESFLSLIVSTSMVYAGKFARKVKSHINYQIHGSGASYSTEQWFVGISECEITLPESEVDTLLEEQIMRIEAEKEKAKPANNGTVYYNNLDRPASYPDTYNPGSDRKVLSFLGKWCTLDDTYNGSIYAALREAQKIRNEEKKFKDAYYQIALETSFDDLFEATFGKDATQETLKGLKSTLAHYINIHASACKVDTEEFLKATLNVCINSYKQPLNYA